MEKIRSSINTYNFTFEEKSIKVSVTIGIAERSEADTIDKWIQVADDRLYNGKTSGKNRVIFK
jgi:diguanylate cyclase (GGDEF)-like protein